MSGRAQAAVWSEQAVSWWIWAIAGASLVVAAPAFSQQTAVPEVVKPPLGESLTVPLTPWSNGGRVTSENPQLDGGRARPIPNTGVLPPPATGTMPVIKPPATTTMPVIPPPGAAGGERSVVPK